MLQKIDQLLRRSGCIGSGRCLRLSPLTQQRCHLSCLGVIVRRRWRASLAAPQEIEHQRHPVSGGDRQHLMHTVGIESREGDLGWLIAGEIKTRLTLPVPHDKLAALRLGGQRQHQSGKHAGCLFGVAVADEETALVVNQELVELGRHLPGDAEAICGLLHDAAKRFRPMLAADADLARLDLPGAPHLGVDDGVGAPAIGCPRCRLDQQFGLRRQQGQRYRAHALDADSRRQKLGSAGCEEIARAVHRAKYACKRFCNGHWVSSKNRSYDNPPCP